MNGMVPNKNESRCYTRIYFPFRLIQPVLLCFEQFSLVFLVVRCTQQTNKPAHYDHYILLRHIFISTWSGLLSSHQLLHEPYFKASTPVVIMLLQKLTVALGWHTHRKQNKTTLLSSERHLQWSSAYAAVILRFQGHYVGRNVPICLTGVFRC